MSQVKKGREVRTNENYNQQDFHQENIGRQRINNRPTLTVMTFDETTSNPNSSYGGGNFNHFSANFDPLKYYQDQHLLKCGLKTVS